MKTIEEVLRECPKHDCAYVLYNGRWHRIEEHQLRWIQLAVIKGEVQAPKLKLNGVIAEFGEDGLFEHTPNSYNGCNIYYLNGMIHMGMLKHIKNEEYGKD